MLKVFLVEDESVIREGLRDNIPWEENGYQFVGEAADGEMALPLIRKSQPDILLTDIKMPFMDGLTLSHILKQELPNLHIIIMSGHDDFEYAQTAIAEGVEQYLLKPITRNKLLNALEETKSKIEKEQKQKQYMDEFQSEMAEYEQFFLRNFFERVCDNRLSVQELYEEARKHSIDIDAPAYNLIMLDVTEDQSEGRAGITATSKTGRENCEEELMRYFLRFGYMQVFRWNINTYGILLRGDSETIDEHTSETVDSIVAICSKYENEGINWHVAAGKSVERFSMLAECFSGLNHLFAHRFFETGNHILKSEELGDMSAASVKASIENVATAQVDPAIIKNFLNSGQHEDVAEFCGSYFDGFGQALKSKIFRDYLLLTVRFAVLSYVESIGYTQEEFLSGWENELLNSNSLQGYSVNPEQMQTYVLRLFEEAIKLRDRVSSDEGRRTMKKALEYIEQHYKDEDMSLNQVAEYTEVSPNYFSTLFSQDMQITFIEYVTEKRMVEAKKLLRSKSLHSGEIAGMVGYKDPHYFSFVFKKTQGISPREYRTTHKK